MNILPEELRQRILCLLPKKKLKELFDDEIIGRTCRNRYYDTIRLDELDIHEAEFEALDVGGELTDLYLALEPLAQYVKEWREEFSCIRFFEPQHFFDFFRRNKGRIDFNRLEINHTDYFFQIAEHCPEILEEMKCIDMGFFFFNFENPEVFRSVRNFRAAASELINRFDQVPAPKSLQTVRFYLPFRISGQKFTCESNWLMAPSIDRSRLTTLEMSGVTIEDLEKFLESLPNLRTLMLRNVPINDYELASLPSGLRHLTLLTLLQTNSTQVRYEFPEKLQFLKLDCIEYFQDSSIPLQIDLSHLTRLVGIYLGGCRIESLENVSLPRRIQHLSLSYSSMVKDLKSLEKYDSLVSFNSDGCLQLFTLPTMFGKQKFPESLEYFSAAHYLSYTDNVPPPITEDISDHYYVESVEGREIKYLMLDHRTQWPSKVKRISINNPKLVLDSSALFPDSVRDIELDGIHLILDVAKLRFPRYLETLRIMRADFTDLDNVQFPETLTRLEVTSCKVDSIKNSNLKSLINLKVLSFAWNALDDSSQIWDELPPNLEELYFFGNPLSKFDLLSAPKLIRLVMNHCNLAAINEDFLKLPDSLEVFEANFNRIDSCSETFVFPSHLKSLCLLENSIDISETFFTQLPLSLEHFETSGKRPISFSGSCDLPSKLQKFNFTHEAKFVSSHILQTVWDLKELYISKVKLTEIDLSALPALLEEACFVDCQFGQIQGNIDHLHKLQNFSLSRCNITNIRFTLPPRLQQISLHDCGIKNLGSHLDCSKCSQMLHLSLYQDDEMNVSSLTESLKEIKRVCPLLRSVSLSEENVNDELESQLRLIGVVIREA